VYAPEAAVVALMHNSSLSSSIKIVNVNGRENLVAVGDASVLRKLEFILHTREIHSQFFARPRVQSLIHFLSDSCIHILVLYFYFFFF
jgi:hypothetical protein